MTDAPVPDPSERLDGDELRRRALRSVWDSFIHVLTGPKRIAALVLLVAAWVGMWGSLSAANVLAGIVVGVVVMAVGFGGRSRGGIRVVPLAKFSGLVAIDTVTSTWSVVREVLTPTDYTEEGIIAVDLPEGSADHLLLLFVAITVTPGTAVVAAEPDGSAVYLHVLHCDRRPQIERHVDRIARLAVAALPVYSTERSTIEQVETTP